MDPLHVKSTILYEIYNIILLLNVSNKCFIKCSLMSNKSLFGQKFVKLLKLYYACLREN